MDHVERQFSVSRKEEVITLIAETIAEIKDVEPPELDPLLYEVIPPDSLEQVVRTSDSEVEVAFWYQDLKVTIRSESRQFIVEVAS